MDKQRVLAVILTASLFGCGSDSDSSSESSVSQPSSDALQGQFVDSAVSNISYRTETLSGSTDLNGYYDYEPGETVTFSIGAITLPAVPAKGIITPLDIARSNDVEDSTVVNIIRLLQSLDSDGDPSNGIEITDEVKAAATENIELEVTVDDFESNNEVTALVASYGHSASLVSTSDAIDHFKETLTQEQITYGKFVGTWAITEVGSSNVDYELLMFTFFSDGSYLHYEVQDSPDNPEGYSGLEWGKYAVSEGGYLYREGAPRHDSNGNYGFGDLVANDDGNSIPEGFDGETIILSFENNGEITFDVQDYEDGNSDTDIQQFSIAKTESNGLLGTWVAYEGAFEGELLVFTFLNDGTYTHAEVLADGSGGMEVGSYIVNEQTGELTVTMIANLNDDIGLSDFVNSPGTLFVDESNDILTLKFIEDGQEGQLRFYRQH